MSATAQNDTTNRIIPDRRVCARYEVCTRTLARWDASSTLGFPKPIVINGRKYRREDELEAWERARVAKGAA
jgi:hypothetical protein